MECTKLELYTALHYYYVTLFKVFHTIHSIPCLQKAGKGLSVLPSCALNVFSVRPRFGWICQWISFQNTRPQVPLCPEHLDSLQGRFLLQTHPAITLKMCCTAIWATCLGHGWNCACVQYSIFALQGLALQVLVKTNPSKQKLLSPSTCSKI